MIEGGVGVDLLTKKYTLIENPPAIRLGIDLLNFANYNEISIN